MDLRAHRDDPAFAFNERLGDIAKDYKPPATASEFTEQYAALARHAIEAGLYAEVTRVFNEVNSTLGMIFAKQKPRRFSGAQKDRLGELQYRLWLAQKALESLVGLLAFHFMYEPQSSQPKKENTRAKKKKSRTV
jgi:hypothetical protein